MKRTVRPLVCSLGGFIGEAASTADNRSAQTLEAIVIKDGLIAHVGCGDGKLTASLRAGD
jgi:hypothetical protein